MLSTRRHSVTFVHQQVVVLCFLLVSQIVGEKDHPELISIRPDTLKMLAVPLHCHADRAVVAIVGALSRFPFDERLPGK